MTIKRASLQVLAAQVLAFSGFAVQHFSPTVVNGRPFSRPQGFW